MFSLPKLDTIQCSINTLKVTFTFWSFIHVQIIIGPLLCQDLVMVFNKNPV